MITRWRTDVISKDIRQVGCGNGLTGNTLDGKELVFLIEIGPVSRFLYFRFIMALIRIRDLDRSGWEDIWARYYTLRPFATLGKYMSKSLLLAIATHQGTNDLREVESFIAEQSFDVPITLTDDESTEAARRVLEAVEGAVERAGGDVESEEESDEESEEEGEEKNDEESGEESDEKNNEESDEGSGEGSDEEQGEGRRWC